MERRDRRGAVLARKELATSDFGIASVELTIPATFDAEAVVAAVGAPLGVGLLDPGPVAIEQVVQRAGVVGRGGGSLRADRCAGGSFVTARTTVGQQRTTRGCDEACNDRCDPSREPDDRRRHAVDQNNRDKNARLRPSASAALGG